MKKWNEIVIDLTMVMATTHVSIEKLSIFLWDILAVDAILKSK